MMTSRQEERAEKEAFWRPHLSACQSSDMSVKLDFREQIQGNPPKINRLS